MPNKVVIELVSGYCNSKCVWCFTSYKCLDRMSKGMMTFDSFKKIIDINEPFDIIPFSHGEALLNPDFISCCTYAESKGFTLTSLNTNLAMEISDELLETLAKIDDLTVNVGGGTYMTHHLNTGTSLNAVLNNLKQLISIPHQNIRVKMVINRQNYNEVDTLKDRIALIDPSISVVTYPLYFGPSDSNEEDKQLFYERNFGSLKNIACRDKVKFKHGKIIVSPKTKKCYGFIPTIRWNGNIEICCRDRYHEKSLGNAFTIPLRNIIESPEYKQAIKAGKKREYIKYCKYCS